LWMPALTSAFSLFRQRNPSVCVGHKQAAVLGPSCPPRPQRVAACFVPGRLAMTKKRVDPSEADAVEQPVSAWLVSPAEAKAGKGRSEWGWSPALPLRNSPGQRGRGKQGLGRGPHGAMAHAGWLDFLQTKPGRIQRSASQLHEPTHKWIGKWGFTRLSQEWVRASPRDFFLVKVWVLRLSVSIFNTVRSIEDK